MQGAKYLKYSATQRDSLKKTMTEAAILSLTAQRGSALIGRFAGITGQTTSYTHTPSGPSYGVGMNFCVAALIRAAKSRQE
jgi:hypothetical protein